MNKEEHFLINHFKELANTAYTRNIYTLTDFLNLNQISILNNMINELPPVHLTLTGGNDYAERKIAVFSPTDVRYKPVLPISLLKVAPINSRFADHLTHRDFLGAILNLGFTRAKIGDIFIKDNVAYVYCINDVAQYIVDNLSKIKHTLIRCTMCHDNVDSICPNFKTIKGTIANIRLDSLIAIAFGTSRNSIISYIENGKVFVNGKLITSNGYSPRCGDIISVRGKGRFVYDQLLGMTKKARNLVEIKLYI